MILTIDINREMSGAYVARAEQSGVLVTEPAAYDSIKLAFREQALNVPSGFAHFVAFTYGGMSTGTYLLEEVPAKAVELADRLMALVFEMHRITESQR